MATLLTSIHMPGTSDDALAENLKNSNAHVRSTPVDSSVGGVQSDKIDGLIQSLIPEEPHYVLIAVISKDETFNMNPLVDSIPHSLLEMFGRRVTKVYTSADICRLLIEGGFVEQKEDGTCWRFGSEIIPVSGVFDDRVIDIYDWKSLPIPDDGNPSYRRGRAQFLFYSPNDESGDTKRTVGCFDGVDGSAPMFVASQFQWHYDHHR